MGKQAALSLCADDGPDVGGSGQGEDQADKQDRGGRPIEAISLAM